MEICSTTLFVCDGMTFCHGGNGLDPLSGCLCSVPRLGRLISPLVLMTIVLDRMWEETQHFRSKGKWSNRWQLSWEGRFHRSSCCFSRTEINGTKTALSNQIWVIKLPYWSITKEGKDIFGCLVKQQRLFVMQFAIWHPSPQFAWCQGHCVRVIVSGSWCQGHGVTPSSHCCVISDMDILRVKNAAWILFLGNPAIMRHCIRLLIHFVLL